MMQEMYEWYMDNLFPEHRKQAIKHAEKDGRDRKKRLAKGGAEKTVQTDGVGILRRKALQIQSGTFSYNPDRSVSKWERIGSPMVASWIDWGVIIDPTGWADPYRRRAKMLAIQRQYDRYQEYSN
jgi:hypothetical protein